MRGVRYLYLFNLNDALCGCAVKLLSFVSVSIMKSVDICMLSSRFRNVLNSCYS